MKTLVKDKLDKTKDMATEKKVMQKEVKGTGSGKAVWKWVAFFALLGTLILAIQLIPMRKGSCFLFCDGNEHEKDDSRSSQSHGEAAAQVKSAAEKLAQVKDAEAAAQVKAAKEKLAQVKDTEAAAQVKAAKEKLAQVKDTEAAAQVKAAKEKLAQVKDAEAAAQVKAAKEKLAQVKDAEAAAQVKAAKEKLAQVKDAEAAAQVKAAEEKLAQVKDPAPVYVLGDLRDAILFKKDIVKLKDIIQQNPSLVHHRDAHGWEAIHEAVRDGNLDIVKILLNEGGANIDARVGSTGQGGSALWLAKKNRDASHPLIVYLLERGAQSIAPTQTTNKKVEL
jgi:predicted MPP superfamily phosphohydrolase